MPRYIQCRHCLNRREVVAGICSGCGSDAETAHGNEYSPKEGTCPNCASHAVHKRVKKNVLECHRCRSQFIRRTPFDLILPGPGEGALMPAARKQIDPWWKVFDPVASGFSLEDDGDAV